MTPATPAAASVRARSRPSPPPISWLAYPIATTGTRGRAAAIRPTRASDRSKVAPAASAPCDARWSVAPSASGSEYGSPTSSRSAPASIAAQAAENEVSASG